MKYYYLKFTDDAEFQDTLISAGLASIEPVYDYQGEETGTQFVANVIALDVVGTIYKPTGTMLISDGEFAYEYPEMVPIDGYHVNMIADLTQEQESQLPMIEKPTTPYRMWAGEE
jgi:hypothetical protein